MDSKKLQDSTIQYKVNDYIIPRETTVNGQRLLIRNDLNDEKVAGQLFAFMYRVMYGYRMTACVVADYEYSEDDVDEAESEEGFGEEDTPALKDP